MKNTNEHIALAANFEGIIRSSLKEKYSDDFDFHTKHNILSKWDLMTFTADYLEHKAYPKERLGQVLSYLFDVKLQFYFIMEVDLGLSNMLVYDKGYDKDRPLDTPHVLLTKLSLDQNVIGKSRILWERIMNLVYYLENGERLENKVTKSKSKRKVFFDFIQKSDKWSFLKPYSTELEYYEQNFRTPEYHKNSVLRAELLGNKTIDPNDLLRLINRASNVIWENISLIIKGQKPTHLTDLHFSKEALGEMRKS